MDLVKVWATDLVKVWATLQLWSGRRQRAGRSSISRSESSEIHWDLGEQLHRKGGRLRLLQVLELGADEVYWSRRG